MLEVEMKFPASDFAAVEARLAEGGAHPASVRQDIDHYFNAPDRDFARTDEALRLRRIGPANFVTYKGPKQDAQTKTRTEIEVPLAEGAAAAEAFRQLLIRLGYRPVAVVRKQRRIYHLDRAAFSLEVCLDEVEGVGRFVELEILAPEERFEDARRVVQDLAAALGLTTSERRSYLELLLESPGGPRQTMSGNALVGSIEAVREAVAEARRRGLAIGLVPTMGALHAGHASLIRAARAETGFVVVSIFVNPIQFGPKEDLARYPRPLEHDLQVCARAGVDLVFHPDAAVMYPPGFRTFVEVRALQDVLCGESRPGHFRGVATVVLKLFHIVQPDVAYFGQKDAQQARIIGQMVRDLDVPVRLRICPIVREPDGLALSSRNQYLDPNQRRQATALYRALEEARSLVEGGERDAAAVQRALAARIHNTPGAVLDYAAVVDADTLQPLTRLSGTVLLALAVKFGTTRLIDNLQLQVET